MPDIIPYCGLAPSPAELAGRWNFDPVLIAVLLTAAGAHAAVLLRRGDRTALAWAALGHAVLLALFVSPLCALASALFSMRMAHHLVLVALAAPALVLGGLRLPFAARSGPARSGLVVAAILHGPTMWFWHAPAPYAAALGNSALYWTMEISLFAAALAFWHCVLTQRSGAVFVALVGTMAHMGLLGAILTFAPRPLYEAHLDAPLLWGLSALEDQQIAGLSLWVVGALPYLAAAVLIASVLTRNVMTHRETTS